MRQLPLIHKFSILLLISLILFGVLLSKIITSTMQNNMIQRANKMAADIVTYEINNKLQLDELLSAQSGHEYVELSQKISTLNLGPDVFRTKIWNKEHRIIWSTKQDEIGKQSLDHHELSDVFKGEIISEISSWQHLSEKYHSGTIEKINKVMEVYIPVRFGPQEEANLDLKVYNKLHPLMAYLAQHHTII